MRSPRARARHAHATTRSAPAGGAGATVAAALAAGVAHHQKGAFDAARAAYSQVLERDPSNFDALHLLGVIAAQLGQPDLAVRMIELALRIRPRSHEALNNLASALLALNENEAAEAALLRALELAPRHADALQNLGSLLLRLGRFSEARDVLARAQRISPRNPGILNNLGNAWRQLNHPAEAEQFFRQALAQTPTHMQALLNLGRVLLDRRCTDEARQLALRAVRTMPGSGPAYRLLGDAHAAGGQADQARECYQHAIALDPGDAAACSNLGGILLDAGDTGAALTYLRRAAALAPQDPDVLVNLARGALDADGIDEAREAALRATDLDPRHVPGLVNLAAIERVRGCFAEAERHCRSALAVAPGWRRARLNLSTALMEMGRFDEADQVIDAMLAADDTDAEAHWQRAISKLARGQLPAGWREFEWRWRLPDAAPARPGPEPEWRGTPLRERAIRVWPEQGLGDEILFASMIPDLIARQARITLECDPRLCELYRRSFPGVRVVPTGSRRDDLPVDVQASLGALAQHLRTSFDDFPRDTGYLVPDPARRTEWRNWLKTLDAPLRVGVSWRSHNLARERRLACTELSQWRRVLERDGVALVCLQYDDCDAEIERFRSETGIDLHRPPCLDQRNDLEGVAALMAELDLVISAPTTVSILAGAVGAPTWQLGSGIDWHGLNRPYSPWQPSVRRFYKPWDRSWDAELAMVACALDTLHSRASLASAPPTR